MITTAHFTNRENALEAFNSLLDKKSTIWILSFSGISGIGKSTLINFLNTNYCPEYDILSKKIDFSIIPLRSDYTLFLDQLVQQFESLIDSSTYRSERDKLLKQFNQRKVEINQEITATTGGKIVADTITQNVEIGQVLRDWEKQTRNQITNKFIDALRADSVERDCVIFLDSFETIIQTKLDDYVDWLFGLLFSEIHNILLSAKFICEIQKRSYPYSKYSGYRPGFTTYRTSCPQLV